MRRFLLAGLVVLTSSIASAIGDEWPTPKSAGCLDAKEACDKHHQDNLRTKPVYRQVFETQLRIKLREQIANSISHIYTLEQTYYGDMDKFWPEPKNGQGAEEYVVKRGSPGKCALNSIKSPIGFEIPNCDMWFFEVKVSTPATGAGFTAKAMLDTEAVSAKYPGCKAIGDASMNSDKAFSADVRVICSGL